MEPSFWRRTPPALFPATLGMFGLSLAWASAARVLDAPYAASVGIFALTTAFFVFAFGCYVAKLIRRPAVVLEDLRPAPARAAVSAGSMCLLLLAAGMSVHGLGGDVARGVWIAGLILHLVYLICVCEALRRSPPEARVVTPVLFLPFVGVIVSPIGGAPLGLAAVAAPVYIYSLVVGAVIVALAAPRFVFGPTPVPARAAAAILLAPTSIGAVSGAALGYTLITEIFIFGSVFLSALFIARIRWLTAGGFTPQWGAFTFPTAAFAGAMTLAADLWGGPWIWGASFALIAASVIVPPIWALTIREWTIGRLAPATGAGVA